MAQSGNLLCSLESSIRQHMDLINSWYQCYLYCLLQTGLLNSV